MKPDNWLNRSKRMICSTCMFFVVKAQPICDQTICEGEDGIAVGRCRRHAPTMAGYPVVFESDWCGDHKLDEKSA